MPNEKNEQKYEVIYNKTLDSEKQLIFPVSKLQNYKTLERMIGAARILINYF
jgi:hypothetical protein